MNLKQLIRDYLKTPRVMQLSTCANNHPWVCNVHYYSDDDFNIYWISTPERRHSKEIEQNPNVSITVKVHEDTPDEKYVIGISAEGAAEMMDDEDAEEIAKKYISKLDKIPTLFEDIKSGRNPHKFYRLKTQNIVLFDVKNFPDDPRQEITL